MTYEADIHRDRAFVHLSFRGEVSMAELERSRTDVVAALKANGLNRLLVDFDEVTGTFSVSDVFRFSAGHARAFPPDTRVAVVTRTRDLTDISRFAQDVATNRGFRMIAFTDVPAAVKWLAG